MGAIGVALGVTVSRGPWEEGWVGWHGGAGVRKRNWMSADGKADELGNGLRGDGKGAVGAGGGE